MTYRLKVNQQWKIVLALILIPLFIVFGYVALILAVRDLPYWAILLSVAVVLGLSIAATLFTIKHWLTVECEIQLAPSGFHFRLIRETPFMHLHEFTCNWANIGNISINEDHQHDSMYYTIQFRKPGMSLYLTDIPEQSIGDGTGSAFWKELNQYADQFNQSTQDPGLVIGHVGFYDKPWAKAFTYFTLVFTGLVLIATVFSPGEGHWWRAAGFSAYTIPWLLNYYAARKKQKQYPGS